LKNLLLNICKLFLASIYAVMKLFPTKDRIIFLSRQGNEPGVDFRLLNEELNQNYPEYETITMCKMIPDGITGKIGYAFHILHQMSLLATSRVAVLDTYCIPVSLLKHKKELKVIQIWHAMGCLKRFGLSSTGCAQGRSEELAKAMNMHKNYDCATCSGPECTAPFAEAFGMPQERMIPIGIPRIDYLTKDKYTSSSRASILAAYPQLDNNKQTIVYVPTFRRGEGLGDSYMEEAFDKVLRAVDYSRFNLIIKAHSGEERVITDSADNRTDGCLFMGLDFIAVADYVVSDYSAIIFEAAVAKKPVVLYCFDWDEYDAARGFYIDYFRDIPFIKAKTAEELMDVIGSGKVIYDEQAKLFSDRYVVCGDYSVSSRLAEICDALASGKFDGVYKSSPYERGIWKSDTK